MAVTFHPATKSQPREIFSFGAFTSVADKHGNLHLISGLPAPAKPAATAPSTTPPAKPVQIRSAPAPSASVQPPRPPRQIPSTIRGLAARAAAEAPRPQQTTRAAPAPRAPERRPALSSATTWAAFAPRAPERRPVPSSATTRAAPTLRAPERRPTPPPATTRRTWASAATTWPDPTLGPPPAAARAPSVPAATTPTTPSSGWTEITRRRSSPRRSGPRRPQHREPRAPTARPLPFGLRNTAAFYSDSLRTKMSATWPAPARPPTPPREHLVRANQTTVPIAPPPPLIDDDILGAEDVPMPLTGLRRILVIDSSPVGRSTRWRGDRSREILPPPQRHDPSREVFMANLQEHERPVSPDSPPFQGETPAAAGARDQRNAKKRRKRDRRVR